MAWVKRIFLFGLVNILVLVTLSIVLNLLGIRPYLTAQGIDYQMLMAFCLVWGMGGAFISLLLSKTMAKWMMGLKIIDPQNARGEALDLLQRVQRLAFAAGLPKAPEVAIYDSAELNAFATGPSRSNSLVAVSSGLLNRMNQEEVDGVLGHEIAHIANGDMVTMTLIQGVINAFVMFFARVVAYAVSQFVKEDLRGVVHFIAVFVFEIAFSLLGFMVVAAFSRYREYRADQGGATFAGRQNMISALQALQNNTRLALTEERQEAIATLQIYGKSSWMSLFSTHPPLEARIERLRNFN